MAATDDVPSFPCLVENLLFEILEFLTLTDRRQALASCNSLWTKRRNLEIKVKKLQIRSRNEIHGALLTRHLLMDTYGPILSNLTNLVYLDVGSHGTDGLLYLLPTSACCSSLKYLSMVGSQAVTDAGLMFLTRRRPAVTDIQTRGILNDQSFQAVRGAMVERPPHRSSPLSSLAYIDLTFCRKTSYEGTMWLRDGLPNLRCIRRVPSWMDGRFHTPFGPDNIAEIHTYWPDGTFSFTRDTQSNGYVMDLFPCDIADGGEENEYSDPDYEGVDFVADKLQYNDSHFVGNIPVTVQFAYRPGVSLMRLSPKVGDDPSTSHVLVAQSPNGLKPPRRRIWMEQIAGEDIPVGQSRYYGLRENHDGTPGDAICHKELIEAQSDADFEINPSGPRPIVMITKMKVEPFVAEIFSSTAGEDTSEDVQTLLPPESLVDACRMTCRNLHQFDFRLLERVENELDIILRRQN
ncbi:hypothetical protein IV203_007010 [Nitzschia inconspicua]|uniref:Uncharacterized protein n=1 Tax=Nitzschia inconspicua TaxID=303405 RepID=A0A9K3KE46_9STRA|nr:hypothetical protein IV203_007010 [Nitzschia inconspicua]